MSGCASGLISNKNVKVKDKLLQDKRNSDWYVEILLNRNFLKLPEQPFSDIMQMVFLNISQNSQENICAAVFLDKVVGFQPASLLENGLPHSYFHVNFGVLSRTPLLQNTPGRMPLNFR